MSTTYKFIKDILLNNGFQIYEYDSRIRSLLGHLVVYKNILGVVEGKYKIHWKYNEEKDLSEINITIYNVNKALLDDVLDVLEDEGVIGEIVDNNIYAKIKCDGKTSISKIRKLVSLLKGIHD